MVKAITELGGNILEPKRHIDNMVYDTLGQIYNILSITCTFISAYLFKMASYAYLYVWVEFNNTEYINDCSD